MKCSSASPDAVVLGLFETGLAVIRSLGRKRLSVCGIDRSVLCGWHSRYVNPLRCPLPEDNEQTFKDFLLSLAEHAPVRPVLFITSDSFLHAVSRNRTELEGSYVINLPHGSLLDQITDKLAFYDLSLAAGISAPLTEEIVGGSEIRDVLSRFSFPVIIKGRNALAWRSVLGPTTKAFIASDKAELLAAAAFPALKGLPLIVQELIPGPDTNHWKFCGYVSTEGTLLCSFTLQKLRQQPIHAGIGTCVESRVNQEVTALGKKLFAALGYRGVGSVEFKQDAETGEYKVIELNPRFWQQNGLADVCGQDFAYTQYLDLRGLRPNASCGFKEGVRWVNVHRDWEAYQSYHKQGELALTDWLASLRSPLMLSDFAWDDPIPFLFTFDLRRRMVTAARRTAAAVYGAGERALRQFIPRAPQKHESGG